MTPDRQTFRSAAVASRFTRTCVKFDKLLAQVNHRELIAIRQKLRDELKAYRTQGMLTVAVIGQYSAGKSSIISALTGRRDIRIDADMTTEKTESYNWHGIKLIDTPGLFTERRDHDEITYEAIAKADLLIFCLTSMLFDTVTVENFKRLAYGKGYRWKMMLVVNKMSDEAGDEQQKIANYRQSLAEALHPYSLDEFPLCFIDAKDYCEGIDTGETFLLQVSRFTAFIDILNQFVEYRGYLTRFDTPIRIALSCVDEAQLSLTRNSNQDSAFIEILSCLSRTIRQERDRLRIKVQTVLLGMSSAVIREGTILAAAVGSDLDFEELNQQVELNLQKHYEKAGQDMAVVVNRAVAAIKQKIEDLLHGNLVCIFRADLEKTQRSARDAGSALQKQRIEEQANWLGSIAETAGVKPITRTTSGEVGSSRDRGTLRVGKFVSFQFNSWQRVGIAKTISHVGKFLRAATALVSTDLEQEEQSLKQMADINRYITSQFQAIAKHLEDRIKTQLWEFEGQVYGELEQKIAVAHQQEAEAMAAANKWVKELALIRRDFELILHYTATCTNSQ
ncbi:MAG TPA: GTPase [Cyanobacteria bacterium UBA8803]|nr:GTPase [Cyanobacteria bacterium UBA9273]HBL60438.1 GTPase [Cyanobacteria bacterium UBA8803]